MKQSFSSILPFVILAAMPLSATVTASLSTSVPSPQLVGTAITLTVAATDTIPGTHDYRFVVSLGGVNQNYVDYNLQDTFTWVPARTEGAYTITVTARNPATGETGQATQAFFIEPIAASGVPSAHPTSNPLIALFSAPACPSGNGMLVRFQRTGSTVSQTTDLRPCNSRTTMNWYIAGIQANSQYQMHFETYQGSNLVRSGLPVTFGTGSIQTGVNIPKTRVIVPAGPATTAQLPILLHSYSPRPGGSAFVPAATDLHGNVLWYLPYPVSLIGRTEPGGNMFTITSGSSDPHQTVVREVDLAGNIIRETNASRVSEELSAFGITHPITQFNHEARALQNGDAVVLASDEMLSTTAQGGTPQKPVDILGDQVLVLDANFQVAWGWDAFDHLDINRRAVLNEVCIKGVTNCAQFHLANRANDWLHSNSVQLTSDGNFIVSVRHQDWVVKIDYSNGTGDGSIIWRMGADGDFTINSADPCPWFSHQHDPNFQDNAMTIMAMYDNGNTRRAKCAANANSRAYVLSVDYTNRQITPTILTDLGAFSAGFGSAQLLTDGNYHFESGLIIPGSASQSIEVNSNGAFAFEMAERADTYRSFRMRTMYVPAVN